MRSSSRCLPIPIGDREILFCHRSRSGQRLKSLGLAKAKYSCKEISFFAFTFCGVRSGHTHYDGRTEWSGINGYNWSSRAYTNAGFQNSFNLNFNASGVNPSNNNNRFWGFPLRCLVSCPISSHPSQNQPQRLVHSQHQPGLIYST